MKKKLALLLAVVMVMSLLPMNLFGARIGRIIDQLNAPEDALAEYTFRIDANALSRLALTDTTMAVLEFTLEGGANGTVGFVMPWGRGGIGNTVSWTATPANSDINSEDPKFIGTSGTGIPYPHIRWGSEHMVSGPAITFTPGPDFEVRGATSGTEYAAVLARLNNIVATDRQYPQTPPGTTSSVMYNRPGANGWDWAGAPINDNRDHPAPHNVFLRQLSLVLLGGSDSTAFPPMDGWIHVTIRGIRAASDEATMSIALQEGGGAVRTRSTDLLREERLNVRWHNGVNLSSVSVVPMAANGVLSGIKIQEDRVGGMLSRDPGTTNQMSYVRLIAPRGFRWDAGWGEVGDPDVHGLWGITPGRVRVHGNTAFPYPSNANNNDGEYEVNVRDNFINEHSGRNEIILEITTPARDTRFAARSTPAEITIHGMNLIPVRGAATTGNVAIDVYVGGPGGHRPSGATGPEEWFAGDHAFGMNRWGIGRPRHLNIPNNEPGHRYFRGDVAGSPWTQHAEGAQHWRERGLVVASFDFEGDVAISGPENMQTVRSGEWTSEVPFEPATANTILRAPDIASGLTTGGLLFGRNHNNRWMNGSNYSLRIAEVVHGSLFRSADRFELVPETEGVRIVDAQFRGGREGDISNLFNWGGFSVLGHEREFVSSVGSFEDDGSVEFFPRTWAPDLQSRLRHLDVRFVLSVEAGHEVKYGDEIGIRVYRNGVHIGTAAVANVYDPIKIEQDPAVEIERNQFDVLALTPVAPFSISEAEAGELEFGDQIRFRLQAVQGGREISIPVGEMELWLSDPVVNTADSGFELRKLPGNQLGFEVRNTSQGTAGSFEIEEVHLAGPTVPGIEWHVVVYGPEISRNSHLILGDTDFRYGSISGTRRTVVAGEINDYGDELPFEVRHGRFDRMPYNAEVLQVKGLAVIHPGAPGSTEPTTPGPSVGRRAFTRATMVEVDGVSIQAVEFPTVAPGVVSSMMNPRVFADFVGATVDWNEAARTATFTGIDTHGNSQTVVLTLDSPSATVNGNAVDIATGAGQGQLAGNIRPVVIEGRSYVPARFLAGIFGVPIEFQSGTVILG